MKKPVWCGLVIGNIFIVSMDLVLFIDLLTGNSYMDDYYLELSISICIIAILTSVVLYRGYYDDNGQKVENYDVQFSISLVLATILLFILV